MSEKKWYVVHTYSGLEQRAKASLEERIKNENLGDFFGEILIPTENVVEANKDGSKKTSKRKFFPGYILVNMELTQQTWHAVKGTPKVTGFVGGGKDPMSVPAVTAAEVARLTKQIDEGVAAVKPKLEFNKGEQVKVMHGPFQNFSGIVDEVNLEKSKLRVLVSIFGRETPVELDFVQVEKL